MSDRDRDFYGNRDLYGNRNFYGNRKFYGNRNFYGNRGNQNFYGNRNFLRDSMNGEEYCESEFMLRNEESCKASSCCQWNTWEEGEASFNGEGRCWSDIGTKMCTDMFEGQGSYRNSFGNRDFYGNHNFYGHRKFHGNNFYGHRNSMYGEEYGVQRKCYNEYWQNTDCSGERSFHSIFRYDESTCISGMEIYGDDNQWYYTPTSRCRDAACMDCEDFTSMPARKHQCMPCSFRDNCSFMRVDCEYDDEYDGSRFGKTDSYHYGSEESVGSNSRATCMDRCQRDGMDQMDCQMRCRSQGSMSDRDRDFYGNQDFYGNRNFLRDSMNGEEYCESEFMLRNEESC